MTTLPAISATPEPSPLEIAVSWAVHHWHTTGLLPSKGAMRRQFTSHKLADKAREVAEAFAVSKMLGRDPKTSEYDAEL